MGWLGTSVQLQRTSFTARRGTLRGMHFQRAPHGEAKLVRCTRGAVWDVLLDLRPGERFGRWVAMELTEANGLAVYLPAGFAHGFQVLGDGAEMHYQMAEQCSSGGRFRGALG